MKKDKILCLAMSFALTSLSVIASASPSQSEPLKQSPVEGEIIDLPELVALIKPSVVTILTFDTQGKPTGQGSGFFIGEDRIVTNHHVIRGADHAEIKLNSGTTIEVAGLLAFDRRHDLALLKVNLSPEQEAAKITPLILAAKMPREGERIAVIGSPLGLEHTVSEGIVSAIRELPGFGTIIQMTAAISPGSSGSPVLNMRGEVIAVARSVVVDAQSLNFAIAIEHVAAMQIGKLKRLSELNRQAIEGSDQAGEEFARGLAAALAEDYQKAIVHFQRVVEIEPDYDNSHYALGLSYSELDRWQEAINAYKQAIRIKPEDSKPYYGLGFAYSGLERIDAFKHSIRLDPDYADTHYALGLAYSDLNRWQEAIDAFKQVIRIKPDYAEAYYNIGTNCDKLGRDQEAIDAYKLAIRIKPDYFKVHHNLGVIYGSFGREREAIDALKQAIRFIEPDVAEAAETHYNLGVVYGKFGRDKEAIDAYKQAIRINPNHSKAHHNLGLCYSRSSLESEAIDALKQAIRIEPDDALAHNNLARVYFKLDQWQEAIDELKQVIRIKPDHAIAHFGLGLAFLKIGNKGSALDEYKILKELDKSLATQLFDFIYD